MRSCWASRWRRATTCLDRRRSSPAAGPRHDRRGLRRARGFARQRAAPPRPAEPRRRRSPVRRPKPARALSAPQQQAVLDLLHAPRFADQAPAEIYASLLDEGVYHCSIRTMYRILGQHGEVRERRAAAPPSRLPEARTAGRTPQPGLVLGHHQTDGADQVELLLSLRHPRHLQPPRGRLVRRRCRKRRPVQAAVRRRHRQAPGAARPAHPACRSRRTDEGQGHRLPARRSRRHPLAQPAAHLQRQPVLRKPLQDPEVPAALPPTLRLHRGCQGLLPPVLRLVQPGPSSRRDRPHDPGPGALRPGRCRPRRPPAHPRSGIPRQPRALRQPATKTTRQTNRRLDQSTDPHG